MQNRMQNVYGNNISVVSNSAWYYVMLLAKVHTDMGSGIEQSILTFSVSDNHVL